MSETPTSVLFVCHANMFRSIMAETILRSRALKHVAVSSAGTYGSYDREYNEVFFDSTRDFLIEKGLGDFVPTDYGTQLDQDLLDTKTLTVFLSNIVHAEAERNLNVPDTAITWNIPDVGEEGRSVNRQTASVEIYGELYSLIDTLIADKKLT